MEKATMASLVEAMRFCAQAPGMSVLQHGLMVKNYYADLVGQLRSGTSTARRWKLPAWIGDLPLCMLPPDEVMAQYHVFHDCGKPAVLMVDEDGRRHFPDHANASKRLWLEAGGGVDIGELIGMDMDIHTLKDAGVGEFASRPQAVALLLTGLAEIHANAEMFGGMESISFKSKWKQIDRRGKAILREIRQREGRAA